MDEADLEVFAAGLRQATAGLSGAELDSALLDLGWADALVDDPGAAVSTLFELLGRARAASEALEVVLLDALAADTHLAVVLPPLGSCDPPGGVVDGKLVVRGLAFRSLGERERALVIADRNGERVTATIDPQALEQRRVAGLDPDIGVFEVRCETAQVGEFAVLPPGAWDGAVGTAQLALGHELVGASRAMLQLATAHARERVQFARPIAAFQAVRHRLADSLVAIEAADAALSASWDDGSPISAAVAKSIAGRSSSTVARQCQQVLAGMGFTTEHPFHRYFRRTLLLDQLLGSTRTLTRALGEELLATGAVPSLIPL